MSNRERTAEVAEGEFVRIPWSAWKAFRRPAFAYTVLCPDKHPRRSVATSQQKGKINE